MNKESVIADMPVTNILTYSCAGDSMFFDSTVQGNAYFAINIALIKIAP